MLVFYSDIPDFGENFKNKSNESEINNLLEEKKIIILNMKTPFFWEKMQ